MPNQLVNENSPYLLQHASNPVDWHPWNEAALQLARQKDKPIFLSIGYSACHWCHVMAHESFEDPQTAALLNAHFICIKVDREERPDLDSIYMSATQALTGSGGWPMSVFLTPGLQPFFAGTYFPPVRRGGLPAFREVLTHLAEAWRERRSEVERVGLEVIQHLRAASPVGEQGAMPGLAALDEAAASLLRSYDWQHGGWGGAPRFPQPMVLEFLLRRLVNPGPRQEETRRAVCHALDAMSRGGMYDMVGGGFSRYSVDDHWHIPHFEKMLPDNAQLARLYLHAALLTGEARFHLVCTRTLDFILREMTGPRGEFHSSLDADSEGHEGRYYLWTWSELRGLLGTEFDFFQAAYGLTPDGNWEGRVVLQRSLDDAALASEMKITAGEVASCLEACHARLLAARQSRPRPAVDDKVLVSWNALALSAFARAARHLGRADYLQAAVRNARFLLDNLFGQDRLLRSWRQGRALHPAGLEDYAGLVLALLDLYQSHPSSEWYLTACRLAGTMIARFSDPQGGFFDTDEQHGPLPLRPKEIQDNALPSGNSLAAAALLHLAAFGDHPEYRDLAVEGIARLAGMARRYPLAFGHWLSAADFAAGPLRQVAVLGYPGMEGGEELLDVLWSTYRPDMVAAMAPFPPPPGSPQLLRDRPLLGGKPTAYVCRDSVCSQPVNSPDGLVMQLRS